MKKHINILCFLAITAILFVSCTNEDFEHFGKIHGTVNDKVTGIPVINASVLLSPGGANKISDSDGYYQFENLEPGQYTVNVQHTDYKTERYIVTVRVGESVSVNFSLTVKTD